MFDPEHLSFSGTLQRSDGRVMLRRRIFPRAARSPWTHSFSGYPRPAETLLAAVRRCAERDLGIHSFDIAPLLPTLSNHITSESGAMEVHPSYLVSSDQTPLPADDIETQWVEPRELGRLTRQQPHEYSPLLSLHSVHVPFFGAADQSALHLGIQKERAIG